MGRRQEADDVHRLSVQQTASRVLLEVASLDEAMAEILRSVATELDWALAIYWMVDGSAGRPSLNCRAIWADETILRAPLVEASRAAVLKAGEDPAGQAMAQHEPVWVGDLAADASPSARLRLAAAAGVQTIAAFPLRRRDEVFAVIELFAREARPADEQTMHLMTAIGHQVCLVLHRMEAQAEALDALQRSRDELETVLRALPDGVTVRDGTGRLVYANEAIARAAGLPDLRATPAELLGRFRMWDESGRPVSADELSGATVTGEERVLRYRPIGDDGGDRWLSVKIAPVAAAHGGAPRAVIVMRDVTAERRDQKWQRFMGDASTALASSMDLQTILDALAALATRTIADCCAVILRRGKGGLRVVAFTGTAPGGPDAVARAQAECLRAAQAAMTAGAPVLDNPPGQSSIIAPLHLRGETVGALVLSTHGEGRRYGPVDLEAAQELARRASITVDNVRLYAEAQESVRAREDLLAIVSHDLRNPLGVVLASSALLLKSSLPADPPGKEGRARRQIEAIERAGHRMNRLIRDLLDFAAIQAGHLSVSSHPREVAALMHEILEALEPLAAAKSIKVLDAGTGESGLQIACDHDRVVQLFSNVVGNAVKFTPEGGTITLRAEADGSMVRFAVADDGPGIPAEELPHVFDRYYQARRRNRDGIGLGLSIARGIVEAHGGRIWVESTAAPGGSGGERTSDDQDGDRPEGRVRAHGATFFFTLPAPQQ